MDVLDAIRNLLEPGAGVTKNDTAEAPYTWLPNTLYVFPVRDTHLAMDIGNPPNDREDFEVAAVFVADSLDEEPQQLRRRDVSVTLDSKAHAYAQIVDTNRTRNGATAPWDYLTVASITWDRLRAFNVRGVELRITGYRYASL